MRVRVKPHAMVFWKKNNKSSAGNSASLGAELIKQLKSVKLGETGKDPISLGLIKNFKALEGKVSFILEVPEAWDANQVDYLKSELINMIRENDGVSDVDVKVLKVRPAGNHSHGGSQGHSHDHSHSHGPSVENQAPSQKPSAEENLKNVKHIIAVASGKGGVGKSTVAVNLAVALSSMGKKVGLLDADIYGPSIPTMLGGAGEQLFANQGRQLVPTVKHGIKIVSMGMLSQGDAPTIWRGPIVSGIVKQFLDQVEWGELDYLFIDLPPGTGDIHLTVCQLANLSGAVIVTTPQDVAFNISKRGLKMFEELKVDVLGVIENMSGFTCGHCGEKTPVFSMGSVQSALLESQTPFLGDVPLDPQMVVCGDTGEPVVVRLPDSPSAKAFMGIAGKVVSASESADESGKSDALALKEVYLGEPGSLKMQWADGHICTYNLQKLRGACRCAGCVDENTGVRKVGPEQISPDIRLVRHEPVGNYGVLLVWDDNHDTGIYSFDRLRGELCQPQGEKSAPQPIN